ncbi:MAG: HAD family hydrolase [Candidatus Binatia bacterium]
MTNLRNEPKTLKFKALLFDAGDVLYYRPRQGVALAAFLTTQGLPPVTPDPQRLMELKRQAFAGQITKEAYQDAVLELYGVCDDAVRIKGRHMLDEAQRDILFFDGVTETLHQLKTAGLRLGVVTNTFDATTDKLQWFHKVSIDSVWDTFATSCELKVCKPDPRIYLAALTPLGLRPEQAAFVGHARVELEGAKALRMTTIAFNRDDETVWADHIVSRFPELLQVAGIQG